MIQAVGMLPILLILCDRLPLSVRRAVLHAAEHLDRGAAGLDQHRAGRRHDLRHPDRRHRPLGRLDPGGLGDGGGDRSLIPGWGLLGIPAALITGLFFGLLNGALIAFVGLPPFIVTLGSLTAVRGLARLMGGDTTVFNPDLPFAFIGNASLVRHPVAGDHRASW